jgi:epoxide hydrolase-like predicted phosphatase
MLKAVIFDCFGVLATDGWLQYCETHLQNKVERSFARELLGQHDRGFISLEEFAEQASELTHTSKEELLTVLSTHNTKNQNLLTYIGMLKKRGYKIGLLSNVGEDWLGKFLTDAERAMFDDILLSYKVGLTKPDPLIYMMSADHLQLLPQECVFIDDRMVCIDGAKTAGMQGILYEDFLQLESDLDRLLADSKN